MRDVVTKPTVIHQDVEDIVFMDIMEQELTKKTRLSLQFKSSRCCLPSNWEQTANWILSPKYKLERKSEATSVIDRTLFPVSIDPPLYSQLSIFLYRKPVHSFCLVEFGVKDITHWWRYVREQTEEAIPRYPLDTQEVDVLETKSQTWKHCTSQRQSSEWALGLINHFFPGGDDKMQE